MNRINSQNKQGSLRILREHFKELNINGIDVLKILETVSGLNDKTLAIDTLNEIVEFLDGIDNTETLNELLKNINTEVSPDNYIYITNVNTSSKNIYQEVDSVLVPTYSDINDTVRINGANLTKTNGVWNNLAFQEVNYMQFKDNTLINFSSGNRTLGFLNCYNNYIVTITGVNIATIVSVSSGFEVIERNNTLLKLKVINKDTPLYIVIPRYQGNNVKLTSITIEGPLSLNYLNNKLNEIENKVPEVDLSNYVTKKEIEDNEKVTAAALVDLNEKLKDKLDKTEYVHLFEVYADEACTQRPVVGEEYNTLYVQMNGSTLYGIWGKREIGIDNIIGVFGPSEVFSSEDYFINLYVDYYGDINDQNYEEQGSTVNIQIQQTIKCTTSDSDKLLFSNNLDVSFGPLIKVIK